MEPTYTIYAPGLWVYDIQPAMESWSCDFDKVVDDHWTQNGIPLTAVDKAMRDEVLPQYDDPERRVKRGRGYSWRFDLTLNGVRALRGEALYRYEFNGGNNNPYGCEDPDPKVRQASKRLMDRCDEILSDHPQESWVRVP